MLGGHGESQRAEVLLDLFRGDGAVQVDVHDDGPGSVRLHPCAVAVQMGAQRAMEGRRVRCGGLGLAPLDQ